jgi:hypothetical protein
MFDVYTIRRMNSSGELTKRGVMDRYGVKAHQVKRAGNNSWKIYLEDGLAYVYHRTEVVRVALNGSVTLKTGGWDTVTTKDRLNRYQDLCRVYSERGEWRVRVYGGRAYPFSGGMTITKDGQVLDEMGRPVAALPEGSVRLAAKAGNIITQAIELWGQLSGCWGGVRVDPALVEDVRLYGLLDQVEDLGFGRVDMWDLMDPHVHQIEEA